MISRKVTSSLCGQVHSLCILQSHTQVCICAFLHILLKFFGLIFQSERWENKAKSESWKETNKPKCIIRATNHLRAEYAGFCCELKIPRQGSAKVQCCPTFSGCFQMVFNLFSYSKSHIFLSLTRNGRAKCFQVISVSLCDTGSRVKPVFVLRGVELALFWQFYTSYFRAAAICKAQPYRKYFLGHL